MRDPKRIDNFLLEVKELWLTHPDWRFSQIFCNLQRYAGNDLFYYEENDIVKLMKEMFGED